MKAHVVLAIAVLIPALAFAELTKDRIVQALSSAEQTKAMVREIEGLPSSDRQKTVEAVARYCEEEFSSGREYHDGKRLIGFLAHVADDATLASVLKPYVWSASDGVRKIALKAVAGGRGPDTGALLIEFSKGIVEGLPSLPAGEADEVTTIARRDTALIFFECLKGLLLSRYDPAQQEGRRIFAQLLNKYQGNSAGDQFIKGVTDALLQAGVSQDALAASASVQEPISSNDSSYPSPQSSSIKETGEKTEGASSTVRYGYAAGFIVMMTAGVYFLIRKGKKGL